MNRIGSVHGVVGLCTALAAPLILDACSEDHVAETRQGHTPAAQTQTVPPALSMGGAKSVTRFFVTSTGMGKGGDLGGLAGADAHCQSLAKAEGAGDHPWRAYLSTAATATRPAV